MKLFRILTAVLCLFLAQAAFAAHQLYADLDGVKIPYGTKFALSMASDVTTQNIVQGDIFQAYLTHDVYVNNKLILPSKTVFRGRVSDVKYSRSLSRPAVLTLSLDHLVTKNGTQLPLNSGIATNFEYILQPDGSLTTNGNYFKAVKRDWKKSGAIVSKTVNWGKTAKDNVFNGAQLIAVPVAAVGGVAACAVSGVYNTFADLFRHGDEIIIKKGANFDIILLSTIEIPS